MSGGCEADDFNLSAHESLMETMTTVEQHRVRLKRIQENLRQVKTKDQQPGQNDSCKLATDVPKNRSLGTNVDACCPKCQKYSAREPNQNMMKCALC